MSDTPNYGLNRKPRFSANHLATYLQAQTPRQREGVIRDAKFPRKAQIVPYTQAKRILCDFLNRNSTNLAEIADDIERLETKWRREPDGWTKAEYRRNIDALSAFIEAYKKTRTKRYTFIPGPLNLPFKVEGVSVNIKIDVPITETGANDVVYSGGCILFVAGSAAARKNLDDRAKCTAAIIHWGLEQSSDNIEVLDRLCLSYDVFGHTITRAPKTADRLRGNIVAACREAAATWDGVEPPNGYDGPDWE